MADINIFGTLVGKTQGGLLQSKTGTLYSNAWVNNSQTITILGITTGNNVIVSPIGNPNNYTEAGIYASAQSENSLTFVCSVVPDNDIQVGVLIV